VSGPLRVAVIGLGWAARSIWLPRLAANSRFVLAAAVDPDPAARAEAGAPVEYATVDELPSDAVDLAIVAAPNHLHAAVAEKLLSAGVPTFVEKPVCLTTGEADRLAAAEVAGGTVLLAGSASRYRADVRRLIEVTADLGELRHVSLSWVRARGIPNGVGWFTRRGLAGGGALVDLGWHLLDNVLPLLGGSRVEQVAGTVSADFLGHAGAHAGWRQEGATSGGDVEDTARGFLVTRAGLSVSLTARWASHQPVDVTTIAVEGSDGVATLECTFGFSPNRRDAALTVIRSGQVTRVPVPAEEIGAEYDRLLDALADRVHDPAVRGTAVAEARQVVHVIERLYEAAPLLSTRSVRPVRAVVFDLDGVVVDSFAVMRAAFTEAYRQVVGDGEPPFAEYNRHLGRYFPDIMRIMGLPLEMEGPFVRASTRLAGEVTLFPGVHDLLTDLRDRGIPTAVATGKAGWRARSLLERLGVLHLFDHVLGSDEVAHAKPAPDIVIRALELLSTAPQDAVMIGDAVTDLTAAKAAGVRAIAALWGETDEQALLAEEPDDVLRTPSDLTRICRLTAPATRPALAHR